MKKISFTLILVTSLYGCGAQDTSVMHAAGKLGRARSSDLLPCTVTKPLIPAAARYIRKIFDTLVAGNQETFTGAYRPEVFCFSASDEDRGGNASADSTNGSVDFDDSLFTQAPNDAAIAGALAHELSHVLNNHQDYVDHPNSVGNAEYMEIQKSLYPFELSMKTNLISLIEATVAALDLLKSLNFSPEATKTYAENQNGLSQFIPFIKVWSLKRIFDVHDYVESMRNKVVPATAEDMKFITDAKVKKGLQDFQENAAKITQELFAIREKSASLLERQANIADALIGMGKDSFFNWKEQEADETGFELYRRAALPTSEYLRVFAGLDTNEGKVCRELLAQGKIPNRGQNTHPEDCWRLYNVEKHKDKYSRYEERSAVLFPGELEQVKKAVAAAAGK